MLASVTVSSVDVAVASPKVAVITEDPALIASSRVLELLARLTTAVLLEESRLAPVTA